MEFKEQMVLLVLYLIKVQLFHWLCHIIGLDYKKQHRLDESSGDLPESGRVSTAVYPVSSGGE